MKSIVDKLREIVAEADDIQVMQIIYPTIPNMILELEKLAAERRRSVRQNTAAAPELPFDSAAPEAGGVKRSGRRVDLYRDGVLVKHCRSIAEATDAVTAAGYIVSRTWISVGLKSGIVKLGEFVIEEAK